MAAMTIPNPYQSVILFENAIADFCGSRFAVATESCTASLFLCLMYLRNERGYNFPPPVSIPKRTYPGVACGIIHSGFILKFRDDEWDGEYELGNLNIWDAALRFKRGMYHGGFQCLSFHAKKNLPIGRGSCILTDDEEAVKWLRKARFDGRNAVPLQEDVLDVVGWNCYLQPEQAARGLMLMQAILSKHPDGPPDLIVSEQKYSDLSIQPAYQKYIA